MLKQRNEQIQILVRFVDIVVVGLAFGLAYWIRWESGLFPESVIKDVSHEFWVLGVSILIHFFVYPMVGLYRSLRRTTYPKIFSMVFRAFIIEFFVLGSFVFLLQEKDTSRLFFGMYLLLNYSFVLLSRVSARMALSSIRRRGYNFRRILIVGTGGNAKRVVQVFKENPHWGNVVIGTLKSNGDEKDQLEPNIPSLGTLEQLREVIIQQTVDEVYFAADRIDSELIEKEVKLCETLGIPAHLSLSWFDLTLSKVTFSRLAEQLPVVTYYTAMKTPLEAASKRFMDICVSSVGLLFTGLLYPWIAYRIKKESPGPVIFKQVRVGENGRRFKCYKFRTMHIDAEKKKEELLAQNRMEGPLFKVENDPRITKFGHFLRKSSLDELPQFFNILRGDMSVVGTRPPTPDEVEKYEYHYRRRLSIRPGLTGLWQVSGRNQIRRFEDVLKLDLQYIDRWSILLDIRIIFRTIWVVLFRRGAH